MRRGHAGKVESKEETKNEKTMAHRDTMGTSTDSRTAGQNKALRAALVRAVEALGFYADPSTYHAIFFVPDRPCGEFADDFSKDHGEEFYDRPMPGKRARAAIDALSAAASKDWLQACVTLMTQGDET